MEQRNVGNPNNKPFLPKEYKQKQVGSGIAYLALAGAGISKRTMKTTKFGIVLLLFALFTSAISVPSAVHAQTYFIQSQAGVPFPFDPYDGVEPIITVDVFSNRLIAVTTQDNLPSKKGVWLVDSKAHPTLLTNIFTEHLEGVTTLTNDTLRWGPWAGKIITGDEDHRDTNSFELDPLIYTVSTNGAIATYHTMTFITNGIFPEDFDVIPANQSLFITAFNNNAVMEIPATYFTNNVGDLLITDAGEVGGAGLYVVHWNAQGSNFVTTTIPIPESVGGHIEGVTFAPLHFPSQ